MTKWSWLAALTSFLHILFLGSNILSLMNMLHANFQARKALHALKGLVKLQALVRGHLVRKQTTATLRGMHALMAIQVRARIHRIQTVEEANILGKQPRQHREIPHSKGHIREDKVSLCKSFPKSSWYNMIIQEININIPYICKQQCYSHIHHHICA